MFETHGESQSQSSATSLGTLSAATVDPPLPAGTYTVELSLEGHPPRSVEVEVKPGETTTVDVVL